jgi:hypothetical protein
MSDKSFLFFPTNLGDSFAPFICSSFKTIEAPTVIFHGNFYPTFTHPSHQEIQGYLAAYTQHFTMKFWVISPSVYMTFSSIFLQRFYPAISLLDNIYR